MEADSPHTHKNDTLLSVNKRDSYCAYVHNSWRPTPVMHETFKMKESSVKSIARNNGDVWMVEQQIIIYVQFISDSTSFLAQLTNVCFLLEQGHAIIQLVARCVGCRQYCKCHNMVLYFPCGWKL